MSIVEKLGITPGPWERRESLGDYWVVGLDGDSVACASAVYPECTITLDESDSRLIAAAPEMLEALIYMLLAIEEEHGVGFIYKSNTPIDSMFKSVQSATGKTWEEIKELL